MTGQNSNPNPAKYCAKCGDETGLKEIVRQEVSGQLENSFGDVWDRDENKATSLYYYKLNKLTSVIGLTGGVLNLSTLATENNIYWDIFGLAFGLLGLSIGINCGLSAIRSYIDYIHCDVGDIKDRIKA